MIVRTLIILLTLITTTFLYVTTSTKAIETRTCPDAGTVNPHHNRELNALLHRLVSNSTFFSIFKVDLDRRCPFWDDNRQCMIRECSVCNCEDNEVPAVWREADAKRASNSNAVPCTKSASILNHVDRSLPFRLKTLPPHGWKTHDDHVWTVQESDSSMMYVDLRKNPEQYTGYAGPHARSIWGAIYDENCFAFSEKCRTGVCAQDSCKEERMLYRLISGVHTSITMHIAKRYLNNDKWVVNTDIYEKRIRAFPERIDNLRVAFALVARAVSKAAANVDPNTYKYDTGDRENDAFTANILREILENQLLKPCEKRIFDESDMFLEKTKHRLPEFRAAFRNISTIMNCVGCEKCRLWGKLQFLGLGTALRILFDDKVPELQRNEVIALFNFMYKLSTSVMWVGKMEVRRKLTAKGWFGLGVLACTVSILLLAVHTHNGQRADRDRRRRLDAQPTHSKGDRGSSDSAEESATSNDRRENGAVPRIVDRGTVRKRATSSTSNN